MTRRIEEKERKRESIFHLSSQSLSLSLSPSNIVSKQKMLPIFWNSRRGHHFSERNRLLIIGAYISLRFYSAPWNEWITLLFNCLYDYMVYVLRTHAHVGTCTHAYIYMHLYTMYVPNCKHVKITSYLE